MEKRTFYLNGKSRYGIGGGIFWPDGYNSNDITDGFIDRLALNLGAEAEIGAEYGVARNRSTEEWHHSSLTIINRYVAAGQGLEKRSSYHLSGCDEVRSALEENDAVEDLHSSFEAASTLLLKNKAISDVLYEGFLDIAAIQGAGSEANVSYEVVEANVNQADAFNVGFSLSGTGEQTISCRVGGGFRFYEYDTGVTERGRWIGGRHFTLEEYGGVPTLSASLEDVVSGIFEHIPPEVVLAALLYDIFTPWWAFAGSDTFYVGDTGSYMLFGQDAFPDTQQVECYSWGWWGSSPAAKASELSPHRYLVARRLKEQMQEYHNMDYGIGGFYQFERHRTGLMAPCSLTIVYPDSDVVGLDETTLAMYREVPDSNVWEFIGGVVDTAANTVTAHVDTLWTFTLAPRMPAGRFSLTPIPDTMPADGVSLASVSSDTILNNDSTVVADGTLFTVWADGCSLLTADADTSVDGVQISCTGGAIAYDVRAEVLSMDVSLGAKSVYGTATGSGSIALTDTVPPAAPTGLVVTCSDGELFATWNPNSELDLGGYLVHYDIDTSGPPYEGTASIRGTHSPIDVGDDTCRVVTGLSPADTFYVTVTAYDVPGNISPYSSEFTLQVSGIPELPKPSGPAVKIFPNPLRESTTIQLNLTSDSHVSVKVYDIRGRLVSTLIDRQVEAGKHSLAWDGRDSRKHQLAPGIYFVRAQMGREVTTRKVVLLR